MRIHGFKASSRQSLFQSEVLHKFLCVWKNDSVLFIDQIDLKKNVVRTVQTSSETFMVWFEAVREGGSKIWWKCCGIEAEPVSCLVYATPIVSIYGGICPRRGVFKPCKYAPDSRPKSMLHGAWHGWVCSLLIGLWVGGDREGSKKVEVQKNSTNFPKSSLCARSLLFSAPDGPTAT